MDERKDKQAKKEVREGMAAAATSRSETDRSITAANPTVPLHGIPGFHHTEEEGDHVPLAHMELDKDEKKRADTGTGDQPGNTGGSRFATPSGREE